MRNVYTHPRHGHRNLPPPSSQLLQRKAPCKHRGPVSLCDSQSKASSSAPCPLGWLWDALWELLNTARLLQGTRIPSWWCAANPTYTQAQRGQAAPPPRPLHKSYADRNFHNHHSQFCYCLLTALLHRRHPRVFAVMRLIWEVTCEVFICFSCSQNRSFLE